LIAALLAACANLDTAEKNYTHAQACFRRGDLAQASAEARAQMERWGKDRQSARYWNSRLLAAEALTAQGHFQDAEVLLAEPVPDLPPLQQQRCRLLIDRATLNLQRFRDASDLVHQVRELACDPELSIRVNLADGLDFMNKGRPARAQDLFRAALDQAEREQSHYFQAVALSNMAWASKRLDRHEESVDQGLRALDAAGKAGALRFAALAHLNLGPAYSLLGDFEAALQHEQKAVEAFRAMDAKSDLMKALGELGLIYDSAHEGSKAIPIYRQAYDMANELNSPEAAARFAANLALSLIKAQQWDEGAEWNERAAQLAGKVGDKERLQYIVQNRGRIAYGRGQFDEARNLSEQALRDQTMPPWIRWSVLDTLAESEAAQHNFARANRHFAQALEIIDNNRSTLAQSQFKITLLSYRIPFYREYVEALEQQKNDMAALRVVESSRARVLEEKLGRELHSGSFSTPAALKQYAKDARVSLLSFWCAGGRSFAWLITARGIQRFNLPPIGEIESLVGAYRKVVEHPIQDPISMPSDLWNRVMAGIAAEIPKNSRVIVIPDGPLHRLNLETLVVPGPKPHYWIEDVEIAVAPSIAIAMSEPAAERSQPSVLLIGDPDYKGTSYETLPGAAGELRDVEACLRPATPLSYTGPKASPQAYRDADPAKFQVIHFAAHAEANIASPLDSAVVLSHKGDVYKLYARDVIDIPIHADLVTLSACRSAGAREYAGEGLIGFAWAFLQAGARSVVAGLWDVSDQSSGPLMKCFYQGIAGRRDAVSALREAKLEMLHGDRFQKPFYWGPFQAYLASARR
jgi:CHAT domain-containing protein